MKLHLGVEPIAAPMRAWRASQRITQRGAAEHIGADSNQWARWERGDHWPDPKWRRAIEALLRTDVTTSPFAAELIAYRQHHALTQEGAAQNARVHVRTWRRWESGTRVPGASYRAQLWKLIDRNQAA